MEKIPEEDAVRFKLFIEVHYLTDGTHIQVKHTGNAKVNYCHKTKHDSVAFNVCVDREKLLFRYVFGGIGAAYTNDQGNYVFLS